MAKKYKNINASGNVNNEQMLNLGKTFEISDNLLKNIAISGSVLAYKDNVALIIKYIKNLF